MLSRKGREVPVDIVPDPESNASRSRFQILIPCILLVIITLGVFQSVRTYEFLSWDDKINIPANDRMNRPGGPDYAVFWREPYTSSYRPLIYDAWSFIADHARLARVHTAPGVGTYQFDPHAFHSVNWILHAINVLLAFFILRLVVKKDWPAFAGALLFGIHPFQNEAVSWITGGNELLYGFFALLTLWQYLLYAMGMASAERETKQARSPARAGRGKRAPQSDPVDRSRAGVPAPRAEQRWVHYGAACLFFILALFTKPTAVCLPFLAAALDVWAVGRPARTVLRTLAPWLPAAVAWVFVTTWAGKHDPTVVHTALWIRPFVAGDSLAFYLYKLLLPFKLVIEYGRSPDYVMAHWWGYLTFLVPLAICGILWKYRQSCPLLLAAYAIFLAALLPTVGLVPNHYQFHSTVADRYMYVAMLGPAVAMSWLLACYPITQSSGKITAAACALFLAYCGTITLRHSRDFRNDDTLYRQTIADNPMSWVSYYNYGQYLADVGRLEEAATDLRAAVRIKPDLADGYNNLGVTLAALNHDPEALDALQKAIELDPQNAFYRISAGMEYEKMGRMADAVSAYTIAMQSTPNDPDTEFHLGTDLLAEGQLADAEAHLTHSLELAPNNPEAENNLATVLAREGKTVDALAHWQKAIQLQPDYVSAYCNYGGALKAMGRTQDAIDQYQTALRLSPQSADAQTALASLLSTVSSGHHAGASVSNAAGAYETLGLQMHSQGRLPEAAAQFQKAAELAPNNAGYRANYGLILSDLGRRPEAIEQLQAAVRLNPRNASALDTLGINQAQSGMLAKAVDSFKRALAIRPNYPEAHVNLGFAFEETGDKPSAIAQFRAALLERPGFTRAQQLLDQALAGR
ncbi:MAG: tetratricopeptide repeat protein [Capsulimonadaceae bacterium]